MACECCGGCLCKAQQLPYTMTVRLTEVGAPCYLPSAFEPSIRLDVCSNYGSGAAMLAEVPQERVEPFLNLDIERSQFAESPEDAIVSYTLEEAANENWAVASITVVSPGTGYTVGDVVTVSGVSVDPNSEFSASVTDVDENGGIVEVTVEDGGLFYALGDGKIKNIVVARGGCGYATKGRSAPTLIPVASGGDSQAVLSVTLEEFSDCLGAARWCVSSVSVTGGANYENMTPVDFRIAQGDSCQTPAQAFIYTQPPTEPTLSVTLPGGTGAVANIQVGPVAWGVEAIDITPGSSPCYQNSTVGVLGDEDIVVYVNQASAPPTLDGSIPNCVGFGGSDGHEVSFSAQTFADGSPYYTVSAIDSGSTEAGKIVDGGQAGWYDLILGQPIDDGLIYYGQIGAVTTDGVVSCVGVPVPSAGGAESVTIVDRGVFAGIGEPPTPPSLFAAFGHTYCDDTFTVSSMTPTRWGVVSIEINEGGSGYSFGTQVSITTGPGDRTDVPFSAVIKTVLEPPVFSASVESAAGSGAVLTFSPPTRSGDWYETTAPQILQAGEGYAVGDKINVTVTKGTLDSSRLFNSLAVSIVSENGAILGYAGAFSRHARFDTGVIESIELINTGSYYHHTGIPAGVRVTRRGSYFRVDGDAPSRVASVRVELDYWPKDINSPVPVTTIIDSDGESENFGQIVSATPDSVSTYSAGSYGDCGLNGLIGRDIVLRAVYALFESTAVPLVRVAFESNFGDGACATIVPEVDGIEYDGMPTPIKSVIGGGGSGYAVFGRVAPPATSDLFRFVNSNGQTDFTWASSNSIAATLSQHQDEKGFDYWSIAQVTITSQTNSTVGTRTILYEPPTTLDPYDYETTTEVPAVISVSRSEAGQPATVTISNGGRYYISTPEAEPYVADINVSVVQPPCATGSGAVLSAVVNADPYTEDQANFGVITEIVVDEPGEGYVLLGGPRSMQSFSASPISSSPKMCLYSNACGDFQGDVFLDMTASPPLLSVGPIVFRVDHEDVCNADEFTATPIFGGRAKATITRGGRFACGTCAIEGVDAYGALATATVTMRGGYCGNLLVDGAPCAEGEFVTGEIEMPYVGNQLDPGGTEIIFSGNGVAEDPPTYTAALEPQRCPTVYAYVLCSGTGVKLVVSAIASCRYCWPDEYYPETDTYSQYLRYTTFQVSLERAVEIIDGVPQNITFSEEFDLFSKEESPLGEIQGKFALEGTVTFVPASALSTGVCCDEVGTPTYGLREAECNGTWTKDGEYDPSQPCNPLP